MITASPKLRWPNASGHSANASGPPTSASLCPLAAAGGFHGGVVASVGDRMDDWMESAVEGGIG